MVMPEPSLSFDFDIGADREKWFRHGNHAVWCGNRAADQPRYVLHEWSEKGVHPFPVEGDKPVFHRVPEGTPYHISRLFGFWVVNDVDAMLLTVKRGAIIHHMLAVGGRTDKPAEASVLFVCPKCAARFGEATFDKVRAGYDRFIDFALTRVRAFNADAELRTCPRCSAVHPPIYGFHAQQDWPEEQVARNAG
jgi:hypothetical protein